MVPLLRNAVLALLALALMARAEVPLVIEGDVVKVVKSLPFKIKASPGWHFYKWNVPASFKYTDDDDTLTIFEAPKGEHKVIVTTVKIEIKIDFEKKTQEEKKIKDTGAITIIIGTDVKPPIDPVTPDDALTAAIRSAYDKETNAKKAELLGVWQQIFAEGGSLIDASTSPPDLFTKLQAALRIKVPKPEFAHVVAAVGKYIDENIAKPTDASLDKAKAKAGFAAISAAMKKVLDTKTLERRHHK